MNHLSAEIISVAIKTLNYFGYTVNQSPGNAVLYGAINPATGEFMPIATVADFVSGNHHYMRVVCEGVVSQYNVIFSVDYGLEDLDGIPIYFYTSSFLEGESIIASARHTNPSISQLYALKHYADFLRSIEVQKQPSATAAKLS